MITAAHCVAGTDPDCVISSISVCIPNDPGGDGTTRIDPNDLNVILGRTTLSNTSEGAEVGVTAVAYRSNYDPNYQGAAVPRYDVGYLVLPSPSAQTQIKIASADVSAVWAAGSPVDISGWGTTSQGGAPVNTLQATTVNVVADPNCSTSYGARFDPGTMLCAAAPGKDTCAGDSGGPLQAPLPGGGYRLVGITGWGQGCAQPGFPGVYARVAGPTMASLIQSDVSNLQATYGLPAEPIFGSLVSPPSKKAATKPYARCKRIKDKKKRKHCVKKVKRKQKTV